ncbi:phage tail tube protein [Glutamicibacter halophytocola]|uniref:phage tail tube protein n=1 Tax=Glutamicibacter halophytocola TaxID=1933880 RepID=UPI0015C5292D|nr:hypothetical protein [Glutamicibacter halophytocola]NQD40511.1 hypothetical protein [Glutamicibacter halophytocola]
MAGARTLAKGKTKLTVLTTAPADEENPTVTELEAGIQASGVVLMSDFAWSAADSATVAEDSLEDLETVDVFDSSTYNLGITLWRLIDEATGDPDPAAEALWEAVKTKGTEFWAYARETGKDSTEAWAAGDEIYLGGRVAADNPQRLDGTGFIKRRIPLRNRKMYNNITVATGA